eukprot:4213685-Alexandrium_andersonii.AAC.1
MLGLERLLSEAVASEFDVLPADCRTYELAWSQLLASIIAGPDIRPAALEVKAALGLQEPE